MIAYHFPPFVGSSGSHRTLKYCRYLREHGWQPVVLTVTPRVYARCSDEDLAELPADVPVYRAHCLDAARDLSVAGRYPSVFALPDRRSTWWASGVLKGMQAIRRWRPDVVWSTYPIATAHLIGGTLARLHRLPWVADFRDWMSDGDVPAGRLQRRVVRRIERYALEHSAAAAFTTQSCRALYRDRYPGLDDGRWFVLPNGYDEADFAAVAGMNAGSRDTLRLLHSGYLYPDDRSPAALFEALARLRRDGALPERTIELRFRAPGDEGLVHRLAERFGVADLVSTATAVPHREAVGEMVDADGLLLLQGQRYARQIPAKAYEYLRTGRPVVTLAPAASESSRLMRRSGWPYQAEIDDAGAIARQLRRLFSDIDEGVALGPARAGVVRYDRRRQAGDLAAVLARVSGQAQEATGRAEGLVPAPARVPRARRRA